jgi:hypothetical protein
MLWRGVFPGTCMCLARLEWSGAGEGVAEAGGALRTGSGQRSKDLLRGKPLPMS